MRLSLASVGYFYCLLVFLCFTHTHVSFLSCFPTLNTRPVFPAGMNGPLCLSRSTEEEEGYLSAGPACTFRRVTCRDLDFW